MEKNQEQSKKGWGEFLNTDYSSSLLRMKMVKHDIAGAGVSSPEILDAFMKVPREKFVLSGTETSAAYGNYPLPIGFGQTVSQPFIVAFMLEMLQCPTGSRILEIGTGSGYQTAILACMGMDVVTLELIPELALRARKTVLELYPDSGIRFIAADGYNGWLPAAPYDGIIVSASPPKVPEELEQQLNSSGGRLVLPAGSWSQRLLAITRRGGDFSMEESLPVRFVPLVRSPDR